MRYIIIISGLLVVVASLGAIKFTQISSLIKMGEQMKKQGPPPEVVSAAVAEEQTWEGSLSAVGSISAAKGVSVSNDAPGVVTRIHFESGATVRSGQVLVELDTNVERAQLASALARKELSAVTVGRSRTLRKSESISQATVDNDEAQLKTLAADVEALQAQISRKVVRAPFAGRLGIRAINVGQYLNAGTTITSLEAMDSVFVDFTMPQQQLAQLKVGMPIRIAVKDSKEAAVDGSITAINPEVDATTRSIKARASVANPGEKFRPGMFVTVQVVLPEQARSVIVPATAVIHAPYGDSVFIIEDKPTTDVSGASSAGPPTKVARQQFVRRGDSRGDFVAIADGVKNGQQVVTAGAFKLRNGSAITVSDAKTTTPQLNPRPANSFGLSPTPSATP